MSSGFRNRVFRSPGAVSSSNSKPKQQNGVSNAEINSKAYERISLNCLDNAANTWRPVHSASNSKSSTGKGPNNDDLDWKTQITGSNDYSTVPTWISKSVKANSNIPDTLKNHIPGPEFSEVSGQKESLIEVPFDDEPKKNVDKCGDNVTLSSSSYPIVSEEPSASKEDHDSIKYFKNIDSKHMSKDVTTSTEAEYERELQDTVKDIQKSTKQLDSLEYITKKTLEPMPKPRLKTIIALDPKQKPTDKTKKASDDTQENDDDDDDWFKKTLQDITRVITNHESAESDPQSDTGSGVDWSPDEVNKVEENNVLNEPGPSEEKDDDFLSAHSSIHHNYDDVDKAIIKGTNSSTTLLSVNDSGTPENDVNIQLSKEHERKSTQVDLAESNKTANVFQNETKPKPLSINKNSSKISSSKKKFQSKLNSSKEVDESKNLSHQKFEQKLVKAHLTGEDLSRYNSQLSSFLKKHVILHFRNSPEFHQMDGAFNPNPIKCEKKPSKLGRLFKSIR